jgi:hypothetical protein
MDVSKTFVLPEEVDQFLLGLGKNISEMKPETFRVWMSWNAFFLFVKYGNRERALRNNPGLEKDGKKIGDVWLDY